MRIQVITKDNGLGLSHDYRVLRDAILLARPGADVRMIDWEQPQYGTAGADLNIFLELLNPRFLPQAKRSVYVPNPEWYFSNMWGTALPRIDQVWAKTDDCLRIFSRLHRNVIKSGWTSEDRLIGGERRKAMLHVAGGSDAKGTQEVIAAMAGLPQHRLTLVSRKDRGRLPANIDFILSPTDDDLKRIQSAHLVHLCPSSYEGFGHYINEARSCGAVVVTTNAAPMNELIDSSTGAAVAPYAFGRQNAAMHARIAPGDLGQVITAVMAANEAVLQRVGDKARARYLAERERFHEFVKLSLS